MRIEGRWFRTLADLDQVAEEWGVLDKPAERAAAHRRERDAYRLSRLEWRSQLPPGHPDRLVRHQDGGLVRYVVPATGEVVEPAVPTEVPLGQRGSAQ